MCVRGCRRKDKFWAVAVDVIRFQTYNLQDNVAILVLLHRKSEGCCGCLTWAEQLQMLAAKV